MSQKEIAVVSGASSGIGAATARLLAKNGYHVIAAARRVDRLKALAGEDSNIEIFELDVTNQGQVDSLAAHLKGKPVSILINNAGGAFDSAEIMNSEPDLWRKTYEVNVIGTVRMVKTDEFAKVRFGGDLEKAAKVYEGVAKPLTDADIAETIRWSVMLPHHINIDSMIIRPVAQAANHKVHRVKP